MRFLHPRLLPLLLVTTLLAASCGSDDVDEERSFPTEALLSFTTAAGLEIEIRTAPTQPPRKGVADLQLLVREGGAPLEGLTIRISPWMGGMGHGSNQVDAAEQDQGIYLAKDALFSMPGPWELILEIGGARDEEATSPTFEVGP